MVLIVPGGPERPCPNKRKHSGSHTWYDGPRGNFIVAALIARRDFQSQCTIDECRHNVTGPEQHIRKRLHTGPTVVILLIDLHHGAVCVGDGIADIYKPRARVALVKAHLGPRHGQVAQVVDCDSDRGGRLS